MGRGMMIASLLACVVLGALAAFTLVVSVDVAKVTEMAKWSLGIFAFVWTTLLAFMAKLSDVTDVSGLTYEQHEKLDRIVRVKIQRLWLVARLNVLGSCVGLVPTLFIADHEAWAIWLFPLLGAMLGLAAFCVLLYAEWLEELRSFRSKQKFEERLVAARDKLLKDGEVQSILTPEQAKQLEGFSRIIH